MASMAFANYRRKSQQMNLNADQKGCGQDQQFGAPQKTTFFGIEDKNVTKKFGCDEDGVTVNSKWFPTSR